MRLGTGVEWKFLGPVGIGAEVGAIVSNEGYPGGILSANGTYHFREAFEGERAVVPFLTAGYSRGPSRTHFDRSLFNVGGGVIFGFRENSGLLAEVRHHVYPERERICHVPNSPCTPEETLLDTGGRDWILDFRVGLTWDW